MIEYETTSSVLARIRKILNMLTLSPFEVALRYHGSNGNGETYDISFKLSDADIILDYEDTTFLDSGTEKVLIKPRLLLSSISTKGNQPTNENLSVEMQWMLDIVDSGRIKLDGYCQLCQMLLNYEEFGWAWSLEGLTPLKWQMGSIMDGSRIAVELKNRLLLRSLYCTFLYTGDLCYGLR